MRTRRNVRSSGCGIVKCFPIQSWVLVSDKKENSLKYHKAATHRTLSRALSAPSRSKPSLYSNWNGHKKSARPAPAPFRSSWLCSLAAILPISSIASRCKGLGTLRTSVQFNKSNATTPRPPPGTIHDKINLFGYSTARV